FQVSSNIVIGFVPVASGGSVYLRADEEADRVAWRKERYPFRKIRAPRFGIATRLLREVGGFESRFERPELACMELAYKAYNYGAYFIPIHVPQAAGGRHLRAAYQASAADKRLFEELCPVNWYRKHDGFYEVPKVSVYIPSFNNAKYIVEAVDSVLNQDFQDLEVCISDDGSTDNTLELLERRYSNEARVRWIVNQNGGIGFASNRAILASRGMYIAQLDSD